MVWLPNMFFVKLIEEIYHKCVCCKNPVDQDRERLPEYAFFKVPYPAKNRNSVFFLRRQVHYKMIYSIDNLSIYLYS